CQAQRGAAEAQRTRDHGGLIAAGDRTMNRGAAPASDTSSLPRNVAVIMDGNGRWAERRGVPVADGHREGTRALRRTVEAAIDLGLRSLVVYAFSTENWARPAEEVDDLMVIFAETIERELPDLAEQGVRTRFIGRRDRAPADLRVRMDNLEAATADRTTLDLWVAFDYGGRGEIVEAARQLVADGVQPDGVDEASFTERLHAPELD